MKPFKYYHNRDGEVGTVTSYWEFMDTLAQPYGLKLFDESGNLVYKEIQDPELDVNRPTFFVSYDLNEPELVCTLDDYKSYREKIMIRLMRGHINPTDRNEVSIVKLMNTKSFYVLYEVKKDCDDNTVRYKQFNHFKDLRNYIEENDPKKIAIDEVSYLTNWKTEMLYNEMSFSHLPGELIMNETHKTPDGWSRSVSYVKSDDYKKLRRYFLNMYVDPEERTCPAENEIFVSYDFLMPENVDWVLEKYGW